MGRRVLAGVHFKTRDVRSAAALPRRLETTHAVVPVDSGKHVGTVQGSGK
ncbi:hypothetical protein ACFPK5_26120 [Streptomyces beijiangensis]